jgi:siderophore synthetase component
MIPPLPYLDRYRNEGTRSYSPHAGYSEALKRFRPDSPHATFDLPVFTLPREAMNVYLASPSQAVRDAYLPGEEVLLCVHPQTLSEFPDEAYVQRTRTLGRPREPIRVTPSSSTRTLYVDEADHALKVHFPFRISRYGRRMRDEVVAQAVAVSRELEAWRRDRAHGPAFLREVMGISHANLDEDSPRGEHWGYLVRDLAPFPSAGDELCLIPGFSLYARDFFHPARDLLVLELAGTRDPVEWTLEHVLLPILRDWIDCYLSLGFILEPHGQNVLLEADDDGAVRRIVHRDLSVGIDMRRRRDLDLPHGGLNGYNRMEDGAFLSIAYDKFMGGHFFDPLVTTLMERDPRLAWEDFRRPCRDEFARAFPEADRYFPSTVHYFSEERDAFGKPLHVDTGNTPTWRP